MNVAVTIYSNTNCTDPKSVTGLTKVAYERCCKYLHLNTLFDQKSPVQIVLKKIGGGNKHTDNIVTVKNKRHPKKII